MHHPSEIHQILSRWFAQGRVAAAGPVDCVYAMLCYAMLSPKLSKKKSDPLTGIISDPRASIIDLVQKRHDKIFKNT